MIRDRDAAAGTTTPFVGDLRSPAARQALRLRLGEPQDERS